jgi:hypothetical protein
LPVLNDLASRYGKQGLVVLAVNVERNRKGYQNYIESNHLPYLRWSRDGTGEISKAYAVRGLPTAYVLDVEGVIHSAHVGYGGGMERVFRREIESLLQ